MQGFELDDFGALVSKVKLMEESCVRLKEKKAWDKGALGKRSYGSYSSGYFEAGSSSGARKKPMYEKPPI